METSTNGYVITHSSLTSNKVEEICQTMTGKGAKRGGKVPSGKALLTCLRALCMSHIIFHHSFDVDLLTVWLGILKSQTDADIDRKVFRTASFLLLEALCHNKQSIKEEQLETWQVTGKEYFELMKREALKGVGIKRAFGLRSLGILCYELTLTKKYNKLMHSGVDVGLQSSVNHDEIFGILNNNLVALRGGANESKEQWSDRIVQLNAVFSALRRFNKPLSKDATNVAFSVFQMGEGSDPHGVKCLMRNAAMVLQNCALSVVNLEDLEFWTSSVLEVFQKYSKLLPLKDDLVSCVLLQISAYLVAQSYVSAQSGYSSQSIDLVIEITKLISNASAKFVGDFIRLFLSPELGWNLFPFLEDRKLGLISIIASALTGIVNRLSIDEVKSCAVFRACENFGRFLVMRPHFSSSEYNHRIFAIDIVNKDGDSIVPLWVALRKQYRKMHEPKVDATNHPPLIFGIASKQGSDTLPKDAKNYWAFPVDQFASASCSVPNPYVYSMLLRCLLWLAPDQRYCRKEHGALWSNFFSSLCDSWELLGLMMETASLTRVSVSKYMVELLEHCFARMKASTFMREDDTSDAFSHGSAHKQIGFRFQFEAKYLEVLAGLSQLTIKYALPHPSLSSLLPNIWAYLFAIVEASSNPDDRQLTSLLLLEHLSNVALMTQVNSFTESSSIGIIEGLKTCSFWYLSKLLPAIQPRIRDRSHTVLRDLLDIIQEEYSLTQPTSSKMLLKNLLCTINGINNASISIAQDEGTEGFHVSCRTAALNMIGRRMLHSNSMPCDFDTAMQHLAFEGENDLLLHDYSQIISQINVSDASICRKDIQNRNLVGSFPLNISTYKIRDCTQDFHEYIEFSPNNNDSDFSFLDNSTRRLSSSKSDIESISVAESVEGLDPFGNTMLLPSTPMRKQDDLHGKSKISISNSNVDLDMFSWDKKELGTDNNGTSKFQEQTSAFDSWGTSGNDPFESSSWTAAQPAWNLPDHTFSISHGSKSDVIFPNSAAYFDAKATPNSPLDISSKDPFAEENISGSPQFSQNSTFPAVQSSTFDVFTTTKMTSSLSLPPPSSPAVPPQMRRGSDTKPPIRPGFLPPPSSSNKRPSQSGVSSVFGEMDNLVGKETPKSFENSNMKGDVWQSSSTDSWGSSIDPFSTNFPTNSDPLQSTSDPFHHSIADPFASNWVQSQNNAIRYNNPSDLSQFSTSTTIQNGFTPALFSNIAKSENVAAMSTVGNSNNNHDRTPPKNPFDTLS